MNSDTVIGTCSVLKKGMYVIWAAIINNDQLQVPALWLRTD